MPKKRSQGRDGLYRRTNSPYWWVSYIGASGQRTRRSTGTTKRKEAETLFAKWKLEAREIKLWDAQPARTFEELMLHYLKATGHSKRSAGKDRQRTRNLLGYFKNRNIYDWKGSDRRGYIDVRLKQGISNATINRELSLLSAAIKYVNREHDWMVPNIAIGGHLKESPGRIRWISRPEAAALIEAARQEPKAPHLADFIILGLNTGMRAHEMLYDRLDDGREVGLEWRRVDLQQNLIYLEDSHQKNGKHGSVPLNHSARAAIVSRLRFRATHCPAAKWVFCDDAGTPIRSVRRSFLTACRRAEIKDFTPHDLRHTCASWLVQAGVPLPKVQHLLRHADIRTTLRYAHLAPEDSRAAVAVLETAKSHFSHTNSVEEKTG